ncbi:MAG: DUF1802 family protein [Thermoanaerobaculia bacterium]
MRTQPIRTALKEWAAVVAGVRAGEQILLLRKGGIHEAAGEFRALHGEFVLFPTFEHQRREHLKPEAARRFSGPFDPEAEAGPLRIDTFARLVEVVALDDAERALRLDAHHLWSEPFIRMRIAYKPERPLQLLFLRAWALPAPIELPRRARYAGCKSWVDLDEEVRVEGASPALGDREFEERLRAVKALLEA